MKKIGRNSPCPCGSGKKYKKCCLASEASSITSFVMQKMRRTEGNVANILMSFVEQIYHADAVVEAWGEFTGSSETLMDEELELDLESFFYPWFLYNWVPDNAGIGDPEHYPEMPIARYCLEDKAFSRLPKQVHRR